MISLKDFMEVCNYRITEGSNYGWSCYGHDAYTLDSWNGVQDGYGLTIIFDTKTQEVYEVQAHDYLYNRAYRLINPNYKDQYYAEACNRNVDTREAWDDVRYIELEVDSDFLEKAQSIIDGVDYDTRVQLEIELDDDLMFFAMRMAHDQDITFNQLVEQILTLEINKNRQ